MKRAAWLSDVHLNFLGAGQLATFLADLAANRPDAVLIGGDIAEAHDLLKFLALLDQQLPCPVYFVLGNHDYYFSSIGEVRQAVREYCRTAPEMVWLPDAGVVELTPKVALVGHDSWADGRLGDYFGSPVQLNDFRLIHDFAPGDKRQHLAVMQRLADEAVEHFRRYLPAALEQYEQVLVLTHVPPTRESCWHEGQTSSDHWLPFFSAAAVGAELLETAKKYPDREITVLCGHTHSEGEAKVANNLRVLTAAAQYGKPQVQLVLDLDS